MAKWQPSSDMTLGTNVTVSVSAQTGVVARLCVAALQGPAVPRRPLRRPIIVLHSAFLLRFKIMVFSEVSNRRCGSLVRASKPPVDPSSDPFECHASFSCPNERCGDRCRARGLEWQPRKGMKSPGDSSGDPQWPNGSQVPI